MDKYVYEHGFTNNALRAAIEEERLSTMAIGMFEDGINQAILAHMEEASIYAAKKYASEKQSMTSGKQVVMAMIKYKLEYQAGFIKANMWKQAMGSIMLQSKSKAIESLQRFADEVAHEADAFETPESQMVNYHKVDWYAKRMGVSMVYAATELYMLTDTSENFEDTWAFLNDQVDACVSLKAFGEEAKMVMDMGTFMATTYLSNKVQ
eukprot:CAMPEP_0117430994 /NCGR_PEP_ID=MMETSP0758-20121206/10554_1 /TAXON_ID=63605 /ORGANISM="Percolomonas cosmopolitus, Strain AE-1 (ATCC 50343)" /LENGTH=207 /DNA_ID=CAMNT_0005219611 /DNA_START=16 /DNA_END=639 /DNA_ORIENTATION=+